MYLGKKTCFRFIDITFLPTDKSKFYPKRTRFVSSLRIFPNLFRKNRKISNPASDENVILFVTFCNVAVRQRRNFFRPKKFFAHNQPSSFEIKREKPNRSGRFLDRRSSSRGGFSRKKLTDGSYANSI